MVKPNYSFEKRQRELAKKKKKEEKLRERADRKMGHESGAPREDDGAHATAEQEGGAPAN